MRILRLVIDVLDLRSELNNKCSALIGGTIYVAIALTLIIALVPNFLYRMFLSA